MDLASPNARAYFRKLDRAGVAAVVRIRRGTLNPMPGNLFAFARDTAAELAIAAGQSESDRALLPLNHNFESRDPREPIGRTAIDDKLSANERSQRKLGTPDTDERFKRALRLRSPLTLSPEVRGRAQPDNQDQQREAYSVAPERRDSARHGSHQTTLRPSKFVHPYRAPWHQHSLVVEAGPNLVSNEQTGQF